MRCDLKRGQKDPVTLSHRSSNYDTLSKQSDLDTTHRKKDLEEACPMISLFCRGGANRTIK